MLRFVLSLMLLAVFALPAAYADDRIGFREITEPDESRPLHVALWYPTKDARPEISVAENPVFYGVSAVRDAKAADGSHPLVLLSHGFGGSFRNLSWLAAALAREGYVVAAVDHPGTTTFDRDPEKAARLWERPRDLSRVLDALLADHSLSIAATRIAAIGHSLGGWTVAELAGARFDAGLVTQDCETRFGAIACKLFAGLGIGRSAAATEKLGSDLRDARIGAVVTLDLGLARGFTPESLDDIHIPFLVIAAGVDIAKDEAAKAEVAATNQDSRYLAEYLPQSTTTTAEIADALHFSFLQICKPGAVDLIEENAPGEGIVCKDGGGRARADIHRDVAQRIITFLAKSLPPE
ncbi:alpha/beta hydrolase family protein [Taklimakanibacter deserti]|uniref:alpha/beta hydrolase family protein n=1 Tax=Taklimakanibacter deserti TaxID=2267839 RepID=UPI000E6507DB